MSPNPRITKKERNLLKGAIRRVFSRSELRRLVIDASVIEGYTDPSRPRVKRWCRCNLCLTPTPKSYMQCDHIDPLVPIGVEFAEMSLDTAVDRLWCEQANLQAICIDCHEGKSKLEARARREARKAKNKA